MFAIKIRWYSDCDEEVLTDYTFTRAKTYTEVAQLIEDYYGSSVESYEIKQLNDAPFLRVPDDRFETIINENPWV